MPKEQSDTQTDQPADGPDAGGTSQDEPEESDRNG